MTSTQQSAQTAPLILETRHEGIATLVMNRPERLNALNTELSSALHQALTNVAHDDTVRVVLLTGAGRAF
jgi:enoyl-CoA hydratase/carnithine racemase